MTRRLLAGMAAFVLAAVLSARAGAAFPAGSQIVRAELDGMAVSVRYSAAEDAELVAALYTEDGKELLASGRRTVSAAADGTARLRLTGTHPEYALLRVFLLGREDHAPLCPVYLTSDFTRPPEEIGETEPKDFAEDRVLAIGSAGFAAVKQGVVLLRTDEHAAGENRLLAREDEALQYKIGTPSDAVRNLRAGQIAALEYERGKLLLLRVRKVTADEDAVTLSGDDSLQLNEVFDLLKLEVSVPAADVTRENDGQNTREGKLLLDEDGLTGEVAVSIAAAANVHGTTEQKMKMHLTPTLSGTVTTDGAVETSIPLGVFGASPAEGVGFRVVPVLHLRTDTAQTVRWTMQGDFGFAYDSEAGLFEKTGGEPEIVVTADQPGTADVQIVLETELTLWENVLSLRMENTLSGTVSVTKSEGHQCLSGTQSASEKSRAAVAPLAIAWAGQSRSFDEVNLPEKTLFRMPEEDTWQEGSCGETPGQPETPETPAPEPGKPGEETPAEHPEKPETPENPETPAIPEKPDTPTQPETPDKTPEEPQKPEIPETPDVPDAPDPPQVPESPETPTTPEEPEAPAEKPYKLENGLLFIEQAEQLADYASEKDVPWYSEREKITEVQLCKGIARIGNYAFVGCENLRVVQIVTPELTIGTGAFADCEALETVYYKGTKAAWRSLAIGAGNDELRGASIHCTNGQIKPGWTIA